MTSSPRITPTTISPAGGSPGAPLRRIRRDQGRRVSHALVAVNLRQIHG